MPRFHRDLSYNKITVFNSGALSGLTALAFLYDPRSRWHVPNLVSVASVSLYTTLSLAGLLSLYLLGIPPFIHTHDHTLFVPNYPL